MFCIPCTFKALLNSLLQIPVYIFICSFRVSFVVWWCKSLGTWKYFYAMPKPRYMNIHIFTRRFAAGYKEKIPCIIYFTRIFSNTCTYHFEKDLMYIWNRLIFEPKWINRNKFNILMSFPCNKLITRSYIITLVDERECSLTRLLG